MLQSGLFSKISKEFPKDEESLNSRLLIRAGFVKKLSAGVYSFLPLGLRVLHKIVDVVKEEMNELGAEEMLMPSLVPKAAWERSNRWNVDVAYKLNSQFGGEFGLGWTHEEVVSDIAKNFIFSYQDLPKAVYQIQTKFRDEKRPKSGLLRGREFLMKDLYSFHADEADLNRYYNLVIGAYKKIFKRLNLEARVTEALGGAFTKEYTHEFQILSGAGEDTIIYCAKCDFSQNSEVVKARAGEKCPDCGNALKKSRAIEAANVFKLGTKYSDAFDLKFKDKSGNSKPVVMGSYGIGPSRIMGALVEIYHDESGIIWPEAVAPFQAHLINLSQKSKVKSQKLYQKLQKQNVEILYDDRDISPGQKFAESDLIGVPLRLVISEKTAGKVEVKQRNSDKIKLVTEKEVIKILSSGKG
ncbi:MAG: hypothetical protein HYT12_04070 [Candidatus Liptonbacteria bacterium]|nr:hypothetical protein [Candidatus Liptonbacteria bacterium]